MGLIVLLFLDILKFLFVCFMPHLVYKGTVETEVDDIFSSENVALCETGTYNEELIILAFSGVNKEYVAAFLNFSFLVSSNIQIRSTHSLHLCVGS